MQITGRSDATLNRGGVRIGTSEVYRGAEAVAGVVDSLVVSLERPDGGAYMPLFVQLQPGMSLDDNLVQRIRKALRDDFSPRHVPDEIVQVEEIPYTMTGKKLEVPVKKILMGGDVTQVVNRDAMKNPHSIEFFITFSQRAAGVSKP